MTTHIAIEIGNAETAALVLALTTALGYVTTTVFGSDVPATATLLITDQTRVQTTALPQILLTDTLSLTTPLATNQILLRLPVTARMLRGALEQLLDR